MVNKLKNLNIFIFFILFSIFTLKNFSWFYSRFLYLPRKVNIIRLTNSQNCEIEYTKQLPRKFSVIIGHAYGSPNNKNNFLSKKVSTFLDSNLQFIENIFFTGDVFSNPTITKWKKLNNIYGKNVNIFIAPGNHDIGIDNSYKKTIFEKSNNKFKKLPFKVETNSFNIIFEDSVSNNWQISKKTIELINKQKKGKKVLLLRHNIPVKEFVALSNSEAGYEGNLLSKKALNKLIKNEILIISGDGGAFSNLPRIYCNKFEKLTFLINGIGEVNGDSLIILNEDSIQRYNLD